MRFLKRIVLFVLVNLLVFVTLSAFLSLLNVRPYLRSYGIDYRSLLLFCLVWGMGGAFISLSLSRVMAKWLMNVRLIDRNQVSGPDRELLRLVERLSREAGLVETPEVGVFPSSRLNAFATGPTKKRALVAVSRGVMERMSAGELEGVVGHEISHIANGDMVTMTLIQGVVNAFVMFLSRALAFFFTSTLRGGQREGGRSYGGRFGSFYLLTFLFELLFLVLGSVVIAFFSRTREYRADRGGALLAGKAQMLSALKKLRQCQRSTRPFFREQEGSHVHGTVRALMISQPRRDGWLSLFATHPPLSSRIERLKKELP